jgi:HEAT repeat protein
LLRRGYNHSPFTCTTLSTTPFSFAHSKLARSRFAPLIDALKDINADVREAAVQALGEIKDARAVAPLIAVLKDEDRVVCYEAAETLEKITGQDFGDNQESWQSWWEANKEKYAR